MLGFGMRCNVPDCNLCNKVKVDLQKVDQVIPVFKQEYKAEEVKAEEAKPVVAPTKVPVNKEALWTRKFTAITNTDISCGIRLIQGLGSPKGSLFQTTFFSKYQALLGPKNPTTIKGDTVVFMRVREFYLNPKQMYVMSSNKAGLDAFESAVKELGLGVTFRTPYIKNYNYSGRKPAEPLDLEGTPAYTNGGIAVLVWMWNGETCDPELAGFKNWPWDKNGNEIK